jgi:succinyl-diaminopimelate desuccinylase
MALLIPRLNEYPFPYQESRLLGKPSLSVNVIRGGNKTNVIPDYCEIEIDMRTLPGQDHQAIAEGVRVLADEVAREVPGLRMEVEVVSDVSPLETDRSNPLVKDLVDSVRSVRGSDPEVGGVAYATDGAHLGPGFGMPVVICGPGAPGMAHQPDEYVETQQLVEAAEIYRDLAIRTL